MVACSLQSFLLAAALVALSIVYNQPLEDCAGLASSVEICFKHGAAPLYSMICTQALIHSGEDVGVGVDGDQLQFTNVPVINAKWTTSLLGFVETKAEVMKFTVPASRSALKGCVLELLPTCSKSLTAVSDSFWGGETNSFRLNESCLIPVASSGTFDLCETGEINQRSGKPP